LVDASRPTISHGTTIAATRTLTTTVAYPSTGGPYPLVVFAHGYNLGPSHYLQIIDAIAAGGYVVAAPSFPLADGATGNPLDEGDIPNQAKDLSFVITQFQGAVGQGGALAGKVDASRVGAVGHSDGADTVLDVGYLPGFSDGRVRAVVSMSPDAMRSQAVGAAPLLLTHGNRDTIVPYSNSQTVFGQVPAHRFFITLLGADHLPPVQGTAPWAAVLDRAVLDLLDHDVAGRTASDDALVADAQVAGVTSLQQAG
jgi:predicted dienelactone hydrolase